MPRRRRPATPPEVGRSRAGADPALSPWPHYLTWLPGFLFDTDKVPERYIGKAWITALVPSIVLAAVVSLATAQASRPDFTIDGPAPILLLVVIGPLLETLLMVLPLLALNRLFGPEAGAVGSALLWGFAHSLAEPAWGLVIWWPFLIMSIAFLTWRRAGLGKAILVVFAIHALQNALPVFLLLMIQ
jgi:membrane protease YdiL (CAAX protease family)